MMSSMCRLLWGLGFMLILVYEDGGADALGLGCPLEACATDLYLDCHHGLQQDHDGCDICACHPAPERSCSSVMCSVLCNYMPHRLYLCPTCPCQRNQRPEPKQFICFGASPEVVNAATTGQINVVSSDVMQRQQELCATTTLRRFRTADGTCNNVQNYGATFLPVPRVLPPAYDDGRQAPRTRGMDGGPLPSARQVSRVVHPDLDRAAIFTVIFMVFGQFLDHDITAIPMPTEAENRTIRCCTEDGHRKWPPPHSDCFPIDLTGDRVFFPRTCMEFIRSVPVLDARRRVSIPRENVNALTAFVDGSAIYGSSDELMHRLREKNGTGMFMKTSPGGFLPFDSRASCIRRQSSDPCFVAGDDRVNEQPGLTALHTIFNRQHNRIAATLNQLLPYESEEEIFQRSRAILGAVLQNIVYGAWLPLVLGPVIMHRFGLNTGSRVSYNPEVDPRIRSEFSTAAFRFGHSLIPPSLSLGDGPVPLNLLFNKPFIVLERLNELVEGLIRPTEDHRGRAQSVDRHFVKEITNRLFEPENRPLRALDLVSLNIQRGRDHGLPPFAQIRKECGLGPVTSFDDPAFGTAGPALRQVYRDVRDIDLFTGGIVEVCQEKGAIVGPTFTCLLARQFHALKFGDRFFFETQASGPSGFSDSQVQELRKATLGWVLCSTLPFTKVQANVFLPSGPDNPELSCREVLARGPDFKVLAHS